MNKEIQEPGRLGCLAIGCGAVAGTAIQAIVPGGPTIVAIGSDIGAVVINATVESIQAPVNIYELGASAAVEIGRFYLGYQLIHSTGDPALGALVYLGIGLAHASLVGYRIIDRVVRNNG
ncbi:hypothetical protein HY029_01675 [Candidatus Gottesmanbacteria bacterium]|nr:hypothetical protein [Candidatus Gottesmanbacteria bacterium]